MKKGTIYSISALCVACLAAACYNPPQPAPVVVKESPKEPAPRTISVTGSAEISVLPDEVVVGLGVRNEHRSLKKAKTENDERMAKVIQIAKDLSIPSEDVKTSTISIYPDYTWKGPPRIRAFSVENSVEIILKNTEYLEPLLITALEAGVNVVHGIHFKPGNDRQHRDEARAKALKAAKQKAQDMAEELDQKLGDPISIREIPPGYQSPYSNVAFGAGGFGDYVMSETEKTQKDTIVPGKVRIFGMVEVVFELVK